MLLTCICFLKKFGLDPVFLYGTENVKCSSSLPQLPSVSEVRGLPIGQLSSVELLIGELNLFHN